MLLCQQELQGSRIDGNDGIDLGAGVFAAQVIGLYRSVAWTAESAYIQVFGVELHLEEHIRPEGRTDPLVCEIMPRVPLFFAVKDEDALRFLRRRGESC